MSNARKPKNWPADMHWPTDAEDAAIQRGIARDRDNPELTAEDFKQARPFKEVFPKQFADWQKHGVAAVRKTGRPKSAAAKVLLAFRLSPDVVAAVRASGRNYNARVEKVLREALAKGQI
jgi:uncharacterized protein (DUF4415 family)